MPAPKKTAVPKKTVAALKKTTSSKAPVPAKEAKPKKPKLVRDSFTCPKDEYLAIDVLKLRAVQQGHVVKKSELLRAGLKLLAGLGDSQLLAALQAVPSIKTGRPKAEDAPVAAPVPAPAQSPAKPKSESKPA
jgi:hypothetical protein